jgi:hypothetical protein
MLQAICLLKSHKSPFLRTYSVDAVADRRCCPLADEPTENARADMSQEIQTSVSVAIVLAILKSQGMPKA